MSVIAGETGLIAAHNIGFCRQRKAVGVTIWHHRKKRVV